MPFNILRRHEIIEHQQNFKPTADGSKIRCISIHCEANLGGSENKVIRYLSAAKLLNAVAIADSKFIFSYQYLWGREINV